MPENVKAKQNGAKNNVVAVVSLRRVFSMKYNMAAITGRRVLEGSTLCRIFYRNFLVSVSNNLGRHAVQTEKTTHVYKQSMNNRDVINYLVKNVAFENEDWIVTNKPYGVGRQQPRRIVPQYSARTYNDVFLSEILPLLAEEFNLKSLQIIFLPERFTSGVTVFGKTTESVEKFKQYHFNDLLRNTLQHGFIAVTLFEPVPKTGEKKFRLKLDEESKSVTLNYRKKTTTGAIIACRHKLMDSSRFCSLVKVNSNKLIHNCVSTYLEEECLSPVLGESLFNSSVSKIGNVSFPVIASQPVQDSKNLNPELLSDLQLHEDEISLIPKHLHLQSLRLKLRKNEEFFVSVPPPDFFLWTCRQLNLSLNKNYC